MMKPIDIVVACSKQGNWIGKNGSIPWKLNSDLKFFRDLTTRGLKKGFRDAVIMGRKTYESIGKPLEYRTNIVLSTTKDYTEEGCVSMISLDQAIVWANNAEHIQTIYIIGGESVYEKAMADHSQQIRHIYVNRVDLQVAGDCKFPAIPESFVKVTSTLVDNGVAIEQEKWGHYNREEHSYLDLVRKIVDHGIPRNKERTNVGTIALFGEKLEFDISERFPLLTTKRTAFRTLTRELLWFMSGSTNSKELEAQKVNIWKGNTSREFLDARGLTELPEGDLGAGYGFQWRHFGGDYTNCQTDYTGVGTDQISRAIDDIKNNSESRRIIVSAWNPSQESQTALMPCHCFFQFFVRNGRLDCLLYQRSCDTLLGQPFNIASYSLLVYMIASVTDLKPGRFIHMLGDTHIYKNHLEGAKELLTREPYQFPKLRIKRKVNSVFEYTVDDFELDSYYHHPTIPLQMAV